MLLKTIYAPSHLAHLHIRKKTKATMEQPCMSRSLGNANQILSLSSHSFVLSHAIFIIYTVSARKYSNIISVSDIFTRHFLRNYVTKMTALEKLPTPKSLTLIAAFRPYFSMDRIWEKYISWKLVCSFSLFDIIQLTLWATHKKHVWPHGMLDAKVRNLIIFTDWKIRIRRRESIHKGSEI